MIPVTGTISLRDNEIRVTFIRSAGPGGQNVNKVATAAQLRFDVLGSPSLPDDVRARLGQLAGRRLTTRGVLVIEARRFRTRERNRRDAIDRLVALVRKAAKKSRRRRPTQPPASSVRGRLESKRRRSRLKSLRRTVSEHNDR